jgi:hypothetical protein
MPTVATQAVGRILLASALILLTAPALAGPASQQDEQRACRESVRSHFEPVRFLFDNRQPATSRQDLVFREFWPANTLGIAVPVVESGWRDVDGPSVRLAIDAAGVISLPGRLGFSAPAKSEIVAQAHLTERLDKALRADRSAGRRRLTIVADRSVRASVVVDVVRRGPPGVPVALVVGKPPSAIAKEHRRVAPFTPTGVSRAIEKALGKEREHILALSSEPDLLRAMWRSFGDCNGIKEAWQMVGQGGGPEVFFPKASEAILACQCRKVDIPVLASVMIFVFYWTEDNGWIPLDAAALRTASKLKADASVADLARALSGR